MSRNKFFLKDEPFFTIPNPLFHLLDAYDATTVTTTDLMLGTELIVFRSFGHHF